MLWNTQVIDIIISVSEKAPNMPSFSLISNISGFFSEYYNGKCNFTGEPKGIFIQREFMVTIISPGYRNCSLRQLLYRMNENSNMSFPMKRN